MADDKKKPVIIIKKKKGGGHGGAHGGAWKVAYADFVTAMMAFFMVMWLMGADEETKQAIADYFNKPSSPWMIDFVSERKIKQGDKFEPSPAVLDGQKGVLNDTVQENVPQNVPDDPTKKDPQSEPGAGKGKGERDTQSIKEAAAALQELVKENNLEEEISVAMDERGVIMRARGNIFFNSGSALLKSEAKPLLDKIVALKKRTGFFLEIAGHTDRRNIETKQFPSNWELSAVRASTVLRFFVYNGVDAKTMRPAGYGDSRPLTDAEGREIANESENRRVEFVFTLQETTSN